MQLKEGNLKLNQTQYDWAYAVTISSVGTNYGLSSTANQIRRRFKITQHTSESTYLLVWTLAEGIEE